MRTGPFGPSASFGVYLRVTPNALALWMNSPRVGISEKRRSGTRRLCHLCDAQILKLVSRNVLVVDEHDGLSWPNAQARALELPPVLACCSVQAGEGTVTGLPTNRQMSDDGSLDFVVELLERIGLGDEVVLEAARMPAVLPLDQEKVEYVSVPHAGEYISAERVGIRGKPRHAGVQSLKRFARAAGPNRELDEPPHPGRFPAARGDALTSGGSGRRAPRPA